MPKYHDYSTTKKLAENASRADSTVVLPCAVGWISVKARDPQTGEYARHTIDLEDEVRQLVERRRAQVVQELRDAGLEVEEKDWVRGPTAD